MDPVQITIIAISVVLTSLLVVLGVQVWYIFKEIRTSLQKFNKMLEDMGKVTAGIGESVSGLAGIATGIKTVLSVFKSFRKREEPS